MAGKVEYQHLPFRVARTKRGHGWQPHAVVERQGGVDAISVRAAAVGAGTTTRAVYALFGSKDGLVEALAQRTFATQTRTAALGQLVLLVERAQAAGLLGSHTVEDVTQVWDAVCMGLAMREICGAIQQSEGARIWTATLQALLAGLGSTDQARPSVTDQPLRPAGSVAAF